MTLIDRAKAFATAKHASQKRNFTNEPYIVHPLAVGELVASIGEPEPVIVAAILHDTLEDTATTFAELQEEFGEEVAALVVEVTNVYTTKSAPEITRAERKAKEQERLAMVSPAAMTIKVADMVDNTSNIAARSPAFAKVYLGEKEALLQVLTKANPAILAKAAELEWKKE